MTTVANQSESADAIGECNVIVSPQTNFASFVGGSKRWIRKERTWPSSKKR